MKDAKSSESSPVKDSFPNGKSGRPGSLQVKCVRIQICGAVQGVGFRPFLFRLARDHRLTGWVSNNSLGVTLEVEGPESQVDRFLSQIPVKKPSLANIQKFHQSNCAPKGYTQFQIVQSEEAGKKCVGVLPDLVLCDACFNEIHDPLDRRYQYPFTNCTCCGPRFSIIEALPYDRSKTTMKHFPMCQVCQSEYDDPTSRRFHSEPNACPDCGPQLELWDGKGQLLMKADAGLKKAGDIVLAGGILALKGLGGFHLICDARNEKAVSLLRKRKERPHKPFAVMFPDLDSVKKECRGKMGEEDLLLSPASPIVILDRKKETGICPSVAPGNPTLGVMLPYTPLHSLLLTQLGFPVVATSGNLSDEPICIDEKEAVERLGSIADFFLVHNRPIVRHEDDSVMAVAAGKPLVIRGGRGTAPLIQTLKEDLVPGIAVGGHLKNTVTVTAGENIVMSQYIGDLDSKPSYDAFLSAIKSLETLYDVKPEFVACDRHPDYYSSQYARTRGEKVIEVQHHHAHIVSCMAEHGLDEEVLGVAWDGLGYGADGSIWGGEFLLSTRQAFKRIGHIRPFRLPGGEKAIQEPRRVALGLLYEIFKNELFEMGTFSSVKSFSSSELPIFREMLNRGLRSPLTTSMGRLFDAVASILNVQQNMSFEGQAAMQLEYLAREAKSPQPYSFSLEGKRLNAWMLDWEPLIQGILLDLERNVPLSQISLGFHYSLVEGLVALATKAGKEKIVLSGGCFQNRVLLERAIQRLKEEKFQVYWPQAFPPNDGGISLGQAVVASEQIKGAS